MDMSEWVKIVADATAQVFPLDFLPMLERAEQEGLFRRLIPVDKLEVRTAGYMLHREHPQWIVGKGRQ